MKRTIKITTLGLLAVAMLAGCSKLDTLPDADSPQSEIRLNTATQAHQTRADAFNPDVQIGASQQVGLYITRADGTTPLYTNYAYTADGLGGLALQPSVATPYYPIDGSSVKISAYHPHRSSSSAAYDFVVAHNQQADAAYYGSDLLFSAQGEYRYQTTAHQLTFAHRLSKATYTLAPGAGSPQLAGATVELLDMEHAVSFDPTTGAVAPASASVRSNTTPHATYGAIVVPQTVAAGKSMLKVTLANGAVLYHKAPTGGQVFAGGVKYHFTITVTYNELAMKVETAPWEPVGNALGDAELGESGGLPLNKAQVGDFYCSDGFGDYILPKDATLTSGQKAACIGIVFWKNPSNAAKGKVVGLAEATFIMWSTELVLIGAGNRTDGRANMTTIAGYIAKSSGKTWDDYPAFKWVASLNGKPNGGWDAADRWYLPAIEELKALRGDYSGDTPQNDNVKVAVNSSLGKLGATTLSDNLYWSSSEGGDVYPGGHVLTVDFYYGSVGSKIKNNDSNFVRSIFAF